MLLEGKAESNSKVRALLLNESFSLSFPRRLEAATNAFFDGRSPMDQDAVADGHEAGPQEEFVCPGEFYKLIWGRDDVPIDPSWLEQDWKFMKLGVVQRKNGPCGLLCVVNGILLSRLLEHEGLLEADHAFSAEEMVDSLCYIVEQCTDEDFIELPLWKGIGPDVELTRLQKGQEAREWMLEHDDSYFHVGSIVLLIYACVFTRGVEKIKADLVEADNEPSLVVGPFWQCSFELMLLLMFGKAHGISNLYAYSSEGKLQNLPPSRVGMLMMSETETGVPVCDSLKTPIDPIWILHGGDHFTIVFSDEYPLNEPDACFQLAFWNGLPPGQGFQELKVFSEKGAIGPAPEKRKVKWFKPRVGEIDELIQAHPGDREKTDYYSQWRFEVLLAVNDPEVKGKPRPPEQFDSHPIYALEEPLTDVAWRCATCYRGRFKTMCFGLNEIDSTECQHCGKPPLAVGWTLWMPYKELPKNWRRHIQKNYGAKVLNLLQTRWPDCDVTFQDDQNLPSC